MTRLLAALLFLLAALPARPQEEPDPLQEKTARHKKDVTRLRGLDFKKPVTVGLYTKRDLGEFLQRELEKEMPREEVERSQRALARFGLIPESLDLYQAYHDLYLGSIAGFYHPETKELRLVKPGEEEQKDEDELRRMGIDVEAVTLVHELTHAAQDQHFELSTLPLDDETNDDLILAVKAVIEGDASAVGWKHGLKGLFDPLMPEYNNLLKQGELPGKAGEQPAYLRLTLTFAYGYGCDFILSHLKAVKGGLADSSKLFADFPLSTEQILHPGKYHGTRDHPTLIAFPDLPAVLGGGLTQTLHNVHGEYAVRILIQELLGDGEEAVKAAEGWDGDRYASLEDAEKRTTVVWFSTWDSEADASEFAGTYARALEKRLKSTPLKADGRWEFLTGGRVTLLERRGQDVLALLGATEEAARRSGAVWKGTTKAELTKLERLRRFVCDPCSVKEAFSGPCPKCRKELRYVDPKKPPEKKRREYSVDR